MCDEARGWLRELLQTLAREAGAADPAALARQLGLLYDGALAGSQMGGGTEPAESARALAQLVLDAALPASAAAVDRNKQR